MSYDSGLMSYDSGLMSYDSGLMSMVLALCHTITVQMPIDSALSHMIVALRVCCMFNGDVFF